MILFSFKLWYYLHIDINVKVYSSVAALFIKKFIRKLPSKPRLFTFLFTHFTIIYFRFPVSFTRTKLASGESRKIQALRVVDIPPLKIHYANPEIWKLMRSACTCGRSSVQINPRVIGANPIYEIIRACSFPMTKASKCVIRFVSQSERGIESESNGH